MGEHDSQQHDEASRPATSRPGEQSGQTEPGRAGAAGAQPAAQASPRARPVWRRPLAASLLGALGVTVISLVFIISFVGALHDPGPRSVPVGIVGTQTQASIFHKALDQQRSGGYVVTTYTSEPAARTAIGNRTIDAALLTNTRVPVLLVATAAGAGLTNAIVQDVQSAARGSGVQVFAVNVRPLHNSDPQGLCQVFFVVALLAPSLVFGNALVTKVAVRLHPLVQLAVLAVYAAIVAAVAITFADAVIGALTGAPWGLFGIGTLLAFAAATTAAAASRWAGGIGYIVVFLLLIPVGVAASGTTLGPNMITPWYADLGRALPAGAALPAVQNTIYFNGNAIATPLIILSAWAVAAAIALALVGILHPPMPGRRARPDEPQPGGAVTAGAARVAS